jgi:hypothetical protein
MAEMGHERRCRDVRGTSALPPIPTRIADIPDSQLGAKSRRDAIAARQPLFDHLVGKREQIVGDFDA